MLSRYHATISGRTASKSVSRTSARGVSPRASAARSAITTMVSAVHPAAVKPFASPSPPFSTWILRWRRPAGACSRSASASSSSTGTPVASSTTSRLRSHFVGCSGVKIASPCANGSARDATRAKCSRWYARRRPSSAVVVLVTAAGPLDHDLVLLDRDLDGAVPGPVLGVDRVVLDGRIEPQAVALLAVVERALERSGALARAAAAARATAGGGLLLLRILVGVVLLGSAFGGLLGELRLLLGAPGLLRLELRGDGGVVLGAEIDLLGGAGA